MKVNGIPYRTIWPDPARSEIIKAIDQRHLPHRFIIEDLRSSSEVTTAIRDMHLRGAPLIGVAAAYGLYLAAREAAEVADPENHISSVAERLKATRPTAVNLAWAVDLMRQRILDCSGKEERIATALRASNQMADQEVERCKNIGEHGLQLITAISARKNGETVNILTHCNAGWLACIDYGTATAPVYLAHERGIKVHVWVDETRPRLQGAGLTAWELLQNGVPHTVIADNTGGHLMQHGLVDLVITGADRVTRRGDAANKIGTYLKALAAKDNGVPFYIALPSSTFDWTIDDGIKEIPIEERDQDEVRYVEGLSADKTQRVLVTPPGSPALNFGFDVTPARLITGLITERGISKASYDDVKRLFPEKYSAA